MPAILPPVQALDKAQQYWHQANLASPSACFWLCCTALAPLIEPTLRTCWQELTMRLGLGGRRISAAAVPTGASPHWTQVVDTPAPPLVIMATNAAAVLASENEQQFTGLGRAVGAGIDLCRDAGLRLLVSQELTPKEPMLHLSLQVHPALLGPSAMWELMTELLAAYDLALGAVVAAGPRRPAPLAPLAPLADGLEAATGSSAAFPAVVASDIDAAELQAVDMVARLQHSSRLALVARDFALALREWREKNANHAAHAVHTALGGLRQIRAQRRLSMAMIRPTLDLQASPAGSPSPWLAEFKFGAQQAAEAPLQLLAAAERVLRKPPRMPGQSGLAAWVRRLLPRVGGGGEVGGNAWPPNPDALVAVVATPGLAVPGLSVVSAEFIAPLPAGTFCALAATASPTGLRLTLHYDPDTMGAEAAGALLAQVVDTLRATSARAPMATQSLERLIAAHAAKRGGSAPFRALPFGKHARTDPVLVAPKGSEKNNSFILAES